MAEPRGILTVNDLAEYLNVHRITIYRLLHHRELPGFKIGRIWRFDLHEIEQWVKNRGKMIASTDGAAHLPANSSAGKGNGAKRRSA